MTYGDFAMNLWDNKKWLTFLEKKHLQIIQEINWRKDKSELLKDDNKFSISFEIELESNGIKTGKIIPEDPDAFVRANGEEIFKRAEQWKKDKYSEDMTWEDALTDYYMSKKISSWPEVHFARDRIYNIPKDGAGLIDLFIYGHSRWVDGLKRSGRIRRLIDGDVSLIKVVIALIRSPELVKAVDGVVESILSDKSKRLQFMKDMGWEDDSYHNSSAIRNQYIERIIPLKKLKEKNYKGTLYDLMGHGKPKMDPFEFLEKFGSKDIVDEIRRTSYRIMTYELDQIYDLSPAEFKEKLLSSSPDRGDGWVVNMIEHIMIFYLNYLEGVIAQHAQSRARRDLPRIHGDVRFENVEYIFRNIFKIPIKEFFPEHEEWKKKFLENQKTTPEIDCSLKVMKVALQDLFPKFMKKYKPTLKFEKDMSLKCGIEFASYEPRYMVGLSKAEEYLEDFFEEFNKQSIFYFNDRTGLHVNIGYLNEHGDPIENYNLIKALMFLNHTYATSGIGFPSREETKWTKDIRKPAFKKIMKRILTNDKYAQWLKDRKFKHIEANLNKNISHIADITGPKYIGFNVVYTKTRRYIEFRFPGHQVSLESMRDALFYYAFIIKAAADPEFKRQEYLGDLAFLVSDPEGFYKTFEKARRAEKKK